MAQDISREPFPKRGSAFMPFLLDKVSEHVQNALGVWWCGGPFDLRVEGRRRNNISFIFLMQNYASGSEERAN